MSKFNTTNQKLQNLWEQVENNNSDIKNKSNIEKFEFFTNLLKQQTIKTPVEIYNSGVITVQGSLPTDTFSAFKGELLPRLYTYNQTINLDLPEIFLPFVKYSVEVIPPPTGEIHGIYEYNPSTWSGDNIEVRGDGLLIWRGSLVTQSAGSPFFIVHEESDLVDKGISLSLTKEVWFGNINNSPVISGKVAVIQGTVTGATIGICTSDTVYTIDHLNKKTHKITNLTNTTITGIGQQIITTRTPDGEDGCDTDVTINEDVAISFAFSGFTGGYDITTIDLAGVLHTTSSGVISSQDFTKEGRWLFWSTEFAEIYSSKLVNIPDGDFTELELLNLPTGSPLPYSQITLKRNTSGAELPIRLKQSEGGVNANFISSLVSSVRHQPNYFKTSPSNATIESYRFKLTGSFIVASPATELFNDPITFPVYQDVYNAIGDAFILTPNHTLLDKDLWVPPNQDVSLTIKAFLINPLYWREERKYNKNDV